MSKNDMKNVYGNAPLSFHYAIVRTLNNLDEKSKITQKSRIMRTVVACALILTIGTASVITAKAIYPMLANRQGNYGLVIDVEPVSANNGEMSLSCTADTSSAPEYVKLKIGYLPDGVTENQGKYSLNGEHSEKCFTFVYDRVSDKQTFTDTFILNYEEFSVNGNKSILADSNDSKRFYIFFEKECLFLTCYVSNDVSNDEIKKVMENLTVIEGTVADNNGGALSQSTSLNNSHGTVDEWTGTDININYSDIKLGQDLSYDSSAFNEEAGFNFSIDKIEVLDNISSLDINKFDSTILDNIDDYVDEKGNITPYTRKVYNYGDGIYTNDELISSETVNRKFVYVTVNVENSSNSDKDFNLAQIGLNYLENNNGVLQQTLDNYEPANHNETNWIDNNNIEKDGLKAGYYFMNVPAKGSKTVHLGFLADEDTLNKLYVTVSGDWCCAIYDAENRKFIENEDPNTNYGYASIKVK